MKILTLVTMVGAASTAVAQGSTGSTPTVPPAAAAFESSALQGAQPVVRTWVASQAAAAYSSTSGIAAIDQSIRASIATRFAGQLVATDADALALLVMTQLQRQLLSDLNKLTEALRLARDEAVSLRAVLEKAKAAADSTAARSPFEVCTPSVCVTLRASLTALAASETKLGVARPVSAVDVRTVADLRAVVMDLERMRALLNELSTEQQRRLQIVTERQQQTNQRISTLLQVIAATQASAIHKLK